MLAFEIPTRATTLAHVKTLRVVALSLVAACAGPSNTPPPQLPPSASEGANPNGAAGALSHPDEVHLADVRQVTRGAGENAEAYWSFDNSELVFQSSRKPYGCDQIYRVPADATPETQPVLVSTGEGRTTCSYFQPGQTRLVWSSTHEDDKACPAAPDMSQGYVWPIYDGYDIYTSEPDGSDVRKLTDSPGYDAEATVCPKDGSIVFTSTRDGDLDLYRMNADGSDVVRLTNTPGYDGGAFFNADCTQIVWRASRPTGDALADYQRLLAQGLVRPSKLELFVSDADGKNVRQISYFNAGSFGPYFYPSGDRIIFSSNLGSDSGREFDMWAINVDGTALERISHTEGFDGFPMFSHDGKFLAFGSNRNNDGPRETDVYVARWVGGEPRQVVERAADRIKRDVAWLADDERGGRGLGTPGLEAAAAYLEQQLAAIGVESVYEGNSYRHGFDVVMGVERTAETALSIDGKAVAAEAFVPASGSRSARASGPVVFANYGITSKELGIDDYRGKNAKGKIVVVRRFAPEGGKFADAEVQRRYSDLDYKAFNAREHGAAGLIVVDVPRVGRGQTMADDAPLPRLTVNRHGDAGIPVVVATREVAGRLVRGRHRASITVDLQRKKQRAHNIVGKIGAGAPNKKAGVLFVGAHYDHLGTGGAGSLHHGGAPAPHNGADDNASGTAALLEVARELARRKGELQRDVYLVAFSAEETGILGSTAITRDLPNGVAASDIVAMLNMDMVGRLRNNQLSVLGGESANEWGEVVQPACASHRVSCALSGDGYGPSDHTPFYAAGAPVLHFFTGAHEQYHTPADDTGLLNFAGTAQIAAIVADVAVATAGREQPLTYKAAPAPKRRGDVRSYGASMGTIPDYAGGDKPGVLLAGVRKGGPADRAGLVRGDRIVKIGATDVRGIRDMMFVLRRSKPGQKTRVTVVREGKNVVVDFTFGKSTRRTR